jgi:hypothetical protein
LGCLRRASQWRNPVEHLGDSAGMRDEHQTLVQPLIATGDGWHAQVLRKGELRITEQWICRLRPRRESHQRVLTLRAHAYECTVECGQLETMFLERARHDFFYAEWLVVVAGEAPHEQPAAGIGSEVERSFRRRDPDWWDRIPYGYERIR